MRGRPAAPRTRFARVHCSDPGIAIFKISGSLGPGAKPLLERLTEECLRRNLPRVVLDLSEVDALGGGAARLLNRFAAERAGRGGRTAFRVTSRTMQGFLCADASSPPPPLAATLEDAVAAVRGARMPAAAAAGTGADPGGGAGGGRGPAVGARAHGPADDALLLLDEEVEAHGELRDRAAAAPPDAWAGIRRAPDHETVRERLAAALHDLGIAARAFFFCAGADGRFYLETRRGRDRERSLPAHGALVQHLLAQPGPGFLVDLDPAGLSDVELEILAELNCEIAAVLSSGGAPVCLLFLSKSAPGEEYSLEELQQLDAALAAAAESLERLANAGARPARAQILAAASAPPAVRPLSWGRDAVPPGAADQVRALRRSIAQIRDILALSQDFDAAFGTSRLLEVLVLSVVSVARVDTVLYFGARDGEYRLTHHRGMSPESIQGLRLRADASLVQTALASPRGVCIADAARITEEERIWARQHGLGYAVPFRFETEALGMLLLGESVDGAPDLETLALLLAQAALAYDRAQLYETLQDRTLGVVRGLITLIEARNGYDVGSTERVVRYTQALARELQLPAESLRDLVFGAVLRDVGMLRVSENLLRSAQDLTADQWDSIRRHPQEGAAIMRQMRFGNVAVDVVLHHHEAYNGEGYPMGLRGRAIPLGARIVAVAESYVKMMADRPYRKALGQAEALESLAENWGLRYDPLVVDALVRVVNRELSLGLMGDRDLARDLFGV